MNSIKKVTEFDWCLFCEKKTFQLTFKDKTHSESLCYGCGKIKSLPNKRRRVNVNN